VQNSSGFKDVTKYIEFEEVFKTAIYDVYHIAALYVLKLKPFLTERVPYVSIIIIIIINLSSALRACSSLTVSVYDLDPMRIRDANPIQVLLHSLVWSLHTLDFISYTPSTSIVVRAETQSARSFRST